VKTVADGQIERQRRALNTTSLSTNACFEELDTGHISDFDLTPKEGAFPKKRRRQDKDRANMSWVLLYAKSQPVLVSGARYRVE
jgi:hypothetical protein